MTADAPDKVAAPAGLAAPDLRAFYRNVYRDSGMLHREMAAWRPSISPYEPILPWIPNKAQVFDMGCGSGALLILLAATDSIRTGVGVDVSPSAIGAARRASGRTGGALSFSLISDLAEMPPGPFEVVLMIDVLHHIPPGRQREAFDAAAARTARGGRLIYKDMAMQPAWRRWANSLHDLIIARQRVRYVPVTDVERWGTEAGLNLLHREAYARLVYGHELRVFSR